MDRDYLQGRDMLIFLVNEMGENLVGFTCIGAAFDSSFSLNHNVLPTAPVDDWNWESHAPGVRSWEMRSNHYVYFNHNAPVGYDGDGDLLSLIGDGLPHRLLFCTAVPSNEPADFFGRRPLLSLTSGFNPKSRMRCGYATLASYTENAPRSGVVTASITLRGSGRLLHTEEDISAAFGNVFIPGGEWIETEPWMEMNYWIDK